MPEAQTTTVDVNGFQSRVWTAGSGPKIGFLAGFGGLPRWIPFLDALAKERTVIVPSLPGFPGGERGHTVLDTHLDWVLATRQLLAKSGLDGADLIGSGPGGSLAAEIAAIWPQSVRRLALIAPWGLFDEADPMTDPWAQRAPDVPALIFVVPEALSRISAFVVVAMLLTTTEAPAPRYWPITMPITPLFASCEETASTVVFPWASVCESPM